MKTARHILTGEGIKYYDDNPKKVLTAYIYSLSHIRKFFKGQAGEWLKRSTRPWLYL